MCSTIIFSDRSEEHTPSKPASEELASSVDSVKETTVASSKQETHPLSRQQPPPSKQAKVSQPAKTEDKKTTDKMASRSRALQPIKGQKDLRSGSKTQQSKIKTKPPSPSASVPPSIAIAASVPSTAIATRGAVSNSVPTTSHSKTKPQSDKATVPKCRAIAGAPRAESRGEELIASSNAPKPLKRGQKSAGGVDIQSPSAQGRNTSMSPVLSNQSLYDSHVTSQESNDKISLVQEENMWNSRGDWEGMDLVMLSRYSTDDDKIRACGYSMCTCTVLLINLSKKQPLALISMYCIYL